MSFAVAVALIAVHVVDVLAVHGGGLPAIVRAGGSVLAVVVAAGAVVLFRRSGRLGRGLLALVIGTGATVVGVGVTVRHVSKAGISGSDYTGTVSLVAGLGLLVLGTVVILAGVRRWWRLLALPVGVLAVYYLIMPLAVAVSVTNVPPTKLGTRTPAGEGLVHRDVTMTTSDGVRLSAWYLPSRNRAAVVVRHGAGSTRSAALDHAVALARDGYGVLAVDARGHGRSGGEGMDVAWYGEPDIEATVSFLARQPDVDPDRIGVLGLSMGGEEALVAAASDPRIRAVVAEGVTIASFADARSLGRDGWLSWPHYWVTYTAADVLSPAVPPIGLGKAVARIAPRPVLLIAGSERAESILGRRYRDAAPGSTELWELPDTPHTRALRKHPDEWRSRVVGFFRRTLVEQEGS